VGEPCPECGAPVGGRDACQKLFDDLGLRAFADPRYAALRRLTVDCYACQHDAYIKSGRSLAAHLTGLAVAIEHGSDEQVNEQVQRWLSRTRSVEKPAVPRARGQITIAEVANARPDEYAAAVRRWAESVWAAWRQHQPLAREWIAAAQRSGSRGR
jgi:2-succinyl-5-enolpyruvyl-6-hydroxy-3-cyclohexene-1-carboxylate synthase